MTQNIRTRENIVLYPHKLGDVYFSLKRIVREKISTCTESIGYITNIHDDSIVIHDNTITTINGSCKFDISYTMETFKPKVDYECMAVITRIVNDGFFCLFNTFIVSLVPLNSLLGWKYENQTLINGDKILTVNQNVRIKLHAVQYNNHKYYCIAHLIQ